MNLKALYKLGYGVYVVTSKKDDRINGQIANTVFQVTSVPPTVAVSINKNNLTTSSSKKAGSLLPLFSARIHLSLLLVGLASNPVGTRISLKGSATG